MLNSTTIKQLIQFANSVTTQGLVNELPDSINMDEKDPYLNTYVLSNDIK